MKYIVKFFKKVKRSKEVYFFVIICFYENVFIKIVMLMIKIVVILYFCNMFFISVS